VVDFPVTHREGVVTAAQMTAIDQIKVMQRLQADWSDNAVSMTVYYKLSELPEVRRYLEQEFRTGIKGISFLLRTDHNFRQAPWYVDLLSTECVFSPSKQLRTEITEQEFEKRMQAIKRPFGSAEDVDGASEGIASLSVADDDELAENAECSGGS